MLRRKHRAGELLAAQFADQRRARRGEERLCADRCVGGDVRQCDERRAAAGLGASEEQVDRFVGFEERGELAEGGVEGVGGGEGEGFERGE